MKTIPNPYHYSRNPQYAVSAFFAAPGEPSPRPKPKLPPALDAKKRQKEARDLFVLGRCCYDSAIKRGVNVQTAMRAFYQAHCTPRIPKL